MLQNPPSSHGHRLGRTLEGRKIIASAEQTNLGHGPLKEALRHDVCCPPPDTALNLQCIGPRKTGYVKGFNIVTGGEGSARSGRCHRSGVNFYFASKYLGLPPYPLSKRDLSQKRRVPVCQKGNAQRKTYPKGRHASSEQSGHTAEIPLHTRSTMQSGDKRNIQKMCTPVYGLGSSNYSRARILIVDTLPQAQTSLLTSVLPFGRAQKHVGFKNRKQIAPKQARCLAAPDRAETTLEGTVKICKRENTTG